MNERTPVSAYRLLSSPSNKSIVFISSRGSPCIFFFDIYFFYEHIKIAQIHRKSLVLYWIHTQSSSILDQLLGSNFCSAPVLVLKAKENVIKI